MSPLLKTVSSEQLRSKFLKLILLSFLALCFYLINSSPTFAQTVATPSATLSSITTTQYIPSHSPNNATKAIYDFGHAVNCIMIGQSPIAPCLEYQYIRDAQGLVKTVPVLSSTNTTNGLLGFTISMIGTTISTPPVRSSEFIADLGEQLGVKSANAQVGGSGSGVLASVFKLWEVSRNIAYLGMIVIFILVGVMVMFRQKLNPQTVVTVQMALPGLVIGLVMITFSYFLASLISDIAFLGTNVVGYYFSMADPAITTPTQLPLIEKTRTPGVLDSFMELAPGGGVTNQEANVLTIFSRYTGIISTWQLKGVLDSVYPYLNDPQRGEFPVLGGLAGLTWQGMDPAQALSIFTNMLAIQFLLPFGSMFGGKGQAVAAIAPGLITSVTGTNILIAYSLSWVAMLVLMYSMIRLLFRLVNSILSIIFLTVTAPFYFLAASLPGRQGMVSDWLFNMLCNVLAFPAVFAVFYFVAFILKGRTSNGVEPLFEVGSGVTLTATTTFPLLGGIDLNFLNILIAFGALVALPQIPDIICKAVGKPSSLAAMAAGAVGAGIGQGQKYQGQVEGGIKSLSGNVGRLTSDPGHIMYVDKETGKYRWRHPDPNKEDEVLRSGARMGQWQKFTGGWEHFPVFGNIMPKSLKTPPPPPGATKKDDSTAT